MATITDEEREYGFKRMFTVHEVGVIEEAWHAIESGLLDSLAERVLVRPWTERDEPFLRCYDVFDELERDYPLSASTLYRGLRERIGSAARVPFLSSVAVRVRTAEFGNPGPQDPRLRRFAGRLSWYLALGLLWFVRQMRAMGLAGGSLGVLLGAVSILLGTPAALFGWLKWPWYAPILQGLSVLLVFPLLAAGFTILGIRMIDFSREPRERDRIRAVREAEDLFKRLKRYTAKHG